MLIDTRSPNLGTQCPAYMVEDASIIRDIQAKLEQGQNSIAMDQLVDLCQELCISGHLAVFSKPYLNKVVNGTKTIESRFSKSRVPPFRCIWANDAIFLKECAGPIAAIALVSRVEFYGPMSPGQAEMVMEKFRVDLALEDPFIETKRDSVYASLIYLQHVTPIKAISVSKSDRRAWVLLNEHHQPRLL